MIRPFTRTSFVRSACALLAIVASAAAQQESAEKKTAPLNLLVITLDTTRRDFMGFLGKSPSLTPNLDRFAQEACVMTDAVTSAPLTLPAHCSLFTGLYPMSHGVHDNDRYRLDPRAVTLAELLHDRGYATRAAVAAFVLDPVFGLAQGFERYSSPPHVARTSGFMTELPARAMVERALADLGELSARPKDGATPPRPFFYWLHLFDPHYPYRPENEPELAPGETQEPIERLRALYSAEIHEMDAELGHLFAFLDQSGLAKNTVIVVVADHGEGLDDAPERSHGHFLYDPTIRIPLVFRVPGLSARNVAVPCSIVDVAPTALAFLGIDPHAQHFDGIDLTRWLREPDAEPPDRVLALETWYVWLAFGWAPYEGCVKGPLKYVHSAHDALFDRTADPREEKNLFAPDEPRAQSLARQLAAVQALAQPIRAKDDRTPSSDPKETALSESERAALRALGYVTSAGATAVFERPADLTGLADALERREVIAGFNDVVAALRRKDIEHALSGLRYLVQREPNSTSLHEQLGELLVEQGAGHLKEATAELDAALRLDPRLPYAWLARARCALQLAEHARAQAKTLRDQGKMREAREPAAHERHERELVEPALRECLTLAPDEPDALMLLGRHLSEQADRVAAKGEKEQAIKIFKEVASLADRLLAVIPTDSPESRAAAAGRDRVRARIAELEGGH